MRKQSNIRWRKRDNEKINRVVKNFNAKITRQIKKNRANAEALPDKISVKELKKLIDTRSDFNFYMDKLQRFSTRGAEEIVTSNKGAKATKWEVEEFEREQQAENKRRKKRAKEIGEKEVKQSGKPTGAKRKEMGTIKENAVKPSKAKFENKSMKEWKEAVKLMERRMTDSYVKDQKQQMLENYVKAMISVGMSDDVLKMMNKIPIEKFLEVVDTDVNASFGFIYDPLELKHREEYLRDAWKQYVDETVNNNIDYGEIVKQVANEKAALYG